MPAPGVGRVGRAAGVPAKGRLARRVARRQGVCPVRTCVVACMRMCVLARLLACYVLVNPTVAMHEILRHEGKSRACLLMRIHKC